MCGITGRIRSGNAVEDLMAGLENLEYRGYDSAGLAVKNGHGIDVLKREGEAEVLRQLVDQRNPTGPIGIGHTRWSTHGPPTDANAHPHTGSTDRVAVVHNGIIENYDTLREELKGRGHEFTSETDTEVVPHLVEEFLDDGAEPFDAFMGAVDRLEGSYALAAIIEGTDAIFATRNGSPLVVGLAEDGFFLASDVPAFIEFTDRVIYLENEDVAVLRPDSYGIFDRSATAVERPVDTIEWSSEDAEKSGFDHYMLKEIHEQPASLNQTIHGRFDPDDESITLDDFEPGEFSDISRVEFVACGTSYHAALYGCHLLGQRGIPAYAHRAGEYASNPMPVDDETLVIGVTQSGETADTLESLRRLEDTPARTLALTNVIGSTAARETDDVLYIRAGPEIGVAATKTFSSQVTALALLSERLHRDITGEPSAKSASLLGSLGALPDQIESILDQDPTAELTQKYQGMDAHFFIGRGIAHPVALEGALKFKEITYEHAEGFAAGQLKHGPLALVTPNTVVIAVFTGDHDEKTLNNVREVQARGASVIAIGPVDADEVAATADDFVPIPASTPELNGLLANVQLQLLSYHVANRLERSIDKPRNLAKSVTVE
ncbi:MAG: glutamine--fructose-6-phosphate transaminase (isomerizing) [Euryarchaeota archaeon]|nr:glutamine--fructose-6-phosphate transaminase (isomerizing) [Euryarchaeota archaeon]